MWEDFIAQLDSLPEDGIAIAVYLLGALILLSCWYSITRRFTAPFGGILWVTLFAMVATPSISEGPNSAISPAIFGLFFGILTKDSVLVWSNLSMLLFVLGVGLLLGYLWNRYQSNSIRSSKSSSPL